VKKLLSTIIGLGTYASVVPAAFATNPLNGGTLDPCTNATSLTGVAKVVCALSTSSIGSTVQKIVIFIIIIAVVIALLYLLYGGIKWITSRGDKTEVEAARNHITAAIVGLIVVFLAIFIIAVVLALFGITTSDLTLPHF
jgi:hypothetical protein